MPDPVLPAFDSSQFSPLCSLFPYENSGARFDSETLRHNFAVFCGSDTGSPEALRLHQEFQRAVLAAPLVELLHGRGRFRHVDVLVDAQGKISGIVDPADRPADVPGKLIKLGLNVGINSSAPWIPHHHIEGAGLLPYHMERGLQEIFSSIHDSLMLGQSPAVLRAQAERLGGEDNHEPISWTATVGIFGGITLPGRD